MAKTQVSGFKPNAVPSKSNANIAGEVDRMNPTPKKVENSTDLRTKRSGK